MRKIIGIGETILDIIFRNNQPSHAVPGGSTFNTLISLGRLGVPATFISEIGKDTVGDIIIDFMKKMAFVPRIWIFFAKGKHPSRWLSSTRITKPDTCSTTSFPKKDSTSCGRALKRQHYHIRVLFRLESGTSEKGMRAGGICQREKSNHLLRS